MKYDDASWHYGGEFPEDLPDEAGATHTGMFLAWAHLAGLSDETFVTDYPEVIDRLRSREITPGKFFLTMCDGKFTDDDLNEQGDAFTKVYFDFSNGQYLTDYEDAVAASELPSLYHVADTWENFDRLKPVLDRRFADWLESNS